MIGSCPTDYRLGFPNKPAFECDCVYIVGGLYGNIFALQEILNMAKSENNAKLVFNGDFHWFDVDKDSFYQIEKELKNHFCTLGNVEMELLREDNSGGCGCNYPSCTSQLTVDYSNEIHSLLYAMVHKDLPQLIPNLAKSSKCNLIKVGQTNVAITHGDEKILSGWLNSYENLSLEQRQQEIMLWLKENEFDILACTHTCSPAAFATNEGVVINNGAAGMANFKATTYGLITRIATTASENALYRTEHNGIFIEALKVEFDFKQFIIWFKNIWTADSPAYKSYFARINGEVNKELSGAIIKGFEIV